MNRFLPAARMVTASFLCWSIPALSWANVSNTANATYQDAAGDSHPATSNTVTITVNNPPVITSTTTATGDVGVALSYAITATNGPLTAYSATPLPSWLTLSQATGIISGTPATAGVTTLTLTATNASGTSAPVTLTITIRPAANITLTKSDGGVNTASSGATLTFAIAYQNTTAGAASNVVITDAIPAGTTFVAGSITGGGTLTGGAITWTIPSVAGNGSGSVSFKVTVN